MMISPRSRYSRKATMFASRQFLSKCPSPILYRSAQLILNQKLKPFIDRGELDFLESKQWKLEVSDARRSLCIQLRNSCLHVSDCEDRPDLVFKGPIASFITLALKEDDPDSLFFNRKLMISGDTALGLEIKNFIDRLPLDEILDRRLSAVLYYLNTAFNHSESTSLN